MSLKVKMSKAIVRRGEVTASSTISRSSASSSTSSFMVVILGLECRLIETNGVGMRPCSVMLPMELKW